MARSTLRPSHSAAATVAELQPSVVRTGGGEKEHETQDESDSITPLPGGYQFSEGQYRITADPITVEAKQTRSSRIK